MGFQGLIPAELVAAIRRGRCVLFAGAGLSAQVIRSNGQPLPVWPTFLIELLEWGISRQVRFWGDAEDIRGMIDRGNLLGAAQELQERMGHAELAEFISRVFRDPSVVPSPAHRVLPHIPFRAIITTNYDALIEGGYSIEEGGRIPAVFTQEDLLHRPSPLRSDDFFLFKIHGHLDRPSSIVLGSRDYQDLLFRTPGYRQFLETLFTTHMVLFVGFGGTDPDLDNVLDRLAAIYTRTLDTHYILLPEGRVNPTEKRRLAQDRRIEVIEYFADTNHSQLLAFLKELRRQVDRDVTEVAQAARAQPGQLRVFISHSMHDAAVAKAIEVTLREHGYAPWMARSETLPSDEIRQRISEAIAAADIFIILFSSEALKSKWVHYEAELAMVREVERRTVVIPLVIGEVLPPSYLRDRVFLRIDGDRLDEGIAGLLRSLASIREERLAKRRRQAPRQ